MKCSEDIQIYNNNIQEDRVYTFLDGLDDWMDKIQSDILLIWPFFIVEQAYSQAWREETRQAVMLSGNSEAISSTAMISKGHKAPQMGLQMTKAGLSVSGKKKGKKTE